VGAVDAPLKNYSRKRFLGPSKSRQFVVVVAGVWRRFIGNKPAQGEAFRPRVLQAPKRLPFRLAKQTPAWNLPLRKTTVSPLFFGDRPGTPLSPLGAPPTGVARSRVVFFFTPRQTRPPSAGFVPVLGSSRRRPKTCTRKAQPALMWYARSTGSAGWCHDESKK